jgi:hypothetical protein
MVVGTRHKTITEIRLVVTPEVSCGEDAEIDAVEKCICSSLRSPVLHQLLATKVETFLRMPDKHLMTPPTVMSQSLL